MLKKAYPFFSYLDYFLRKEDLYSLQSPMLFAMYGELKGFRKSRQYNDLDIEQYRSNLLASKESIDVDDFDAGSKHLPNSSRQVAEITKFSTTNRKFAQLYQFFCNKTAAQNVLELGTCVGITTRYLSKVTTGKIYSFEGSPEIARIAASASEYKNLELIEGNINTTLPALLKTGDLVDFALIDAAHTYEATIRYFQQLKSNLHSGSIVAVGDIHWSKEMNRAWEYIKSDEAVILTLDFYECGIIFFEYAGPKSHYILDY